MQEQAARPNKELHSQAGCARSPRSSPMASLEDGGGGREPLAFSAPSPSARDRRRQTGPGAAARRAALAAEMALPANAAVGWSGQSRGQRCVGDGAIGVAGSGGSEPAASALRGEGGNAGVASVRVACAWSSRPDVPGVAAFL